MIEFKNVSAGYRDHTALEGLNIRIKAGEFLGVIGPNGSGKSTFIRLINGLLLPSSGQVLVDGLNTAVDDLFDIRKKQARYFRIRIIRL